MVCFGGRRAGHWSSLLLGSLFLLSSGNGTHGNRAGPVGLVLMVFGGATALASILAGNRIPRRLRVPSRVSTDRDAWWQTSCTLSLPAGRYHVGSQSLHQTSNARAAVYIVPVGLTFIDAIHSGPSKVFGWTPHSLGTLQVRFAVP